MKTYTKLFLIGLALTLTACSSKQMHPVGIGRDANKLKKSPCACIEIKQNYDEWTA